MKLQWSIIIGKKGEMQKVREGGHTERQKGKEWSVTMRGRGGIWDTCNKQNGWFLLFLTHAICCCDWNRKTEWGWWRGTVKNNDKWDIQQGWERQKRKKNCDGKLLEPFGPQSAANDSCLQWEDGKRSRTMMETKMVHSTECYAPIMTASILHCHKHSQTADIIAEDRDEWAGWIIIRN